MHFVDLKNNHTKPWKLLEEHPYYEAAKNQEDRMAAMRLVHHILNTPENLVQLKAISKIFSGSIIVPIHALESKGKNKIPGMLAEYIGIYTGLEVDNTIVQSNRVFRTGNDEWYRFAFRPAFEGKVSPGRKYILVDDVFAFGGSFNELRLHIEKNNGKVVYTAALSLGGHGDKIAPEPKVLKALIDKFQADKVNSFLKEIDIYGGNYKALTNPEAFALGRAPSLDEARNRILTARQEGRSRMGSENAQKNENKTPPITDQKIFRRRPSR